MVLCESETRFAFDGGGTVIVRMERWSDRREGGVVVVVAVVDLYATIKPVRPVTCASVDPLRSPAVLVWTAWPA